MNDKETVKTKKRSKRNVKLDDESSDKKVVYCGRTYHQGSIDKKSEKYKELREKNNVAVKRSRNAAKIKINLDKEHLENLKVTFKKMMKKKEKTVSSIKLMKKYIFENF